MSDETPIYQGRDADGRFSAGDKPPPPPPPSEEGAVASGYQPPKLPPTCDNQCVGRIYAFKTQFGVPQDVALRMYNQEKEALQRKAREAEEAEEKHLRYLEKQEQELAEAERAISAQGAADVAKEILLPQDTADWLLAAGGLITRLPRGGQTAYRIANKGKALEEIRKKRQALNAEIKAGRAKKGAVVEKKELPSLRQRYVDEVEKLKSKRESMRAAGKSDEEIARELHAERRAIGEKYKSMTPPEKLEEIYERNLNKYGDRLGPTVDWLRAQGKTWEQIAESATRTGGKDLGF